MQSNISGFLRKYNNTLCVINKSSKNNDVRDSTGFYPRKAARGCKYHSNKFFMNIINIYLHAEHLQCL